MFLNHLTNHKSRKLWPHQHWPLFKVTQEESHDRRSKYRKKHKSFQKAKKNNILHTEFFHSMCCILSWNVCGCEFTLKYNVSCLLLNYLKIVLIKHSDDLIWWGTNDIARLLSCIHCTSYHNVEIMSVSQKLNKK